MWVSCTNSPKIVDPYCCSFSASIHSTIESSIIKLVVPEPHSFPSDKKNKQRVWQLHWNVVNLSLVLIKCISWARNRHSNCTKRRFFASICSVNYEVQWLNNWAHSHHIKSAIILLLLFSFFTHNTQLIFRMKLSFLQPWNIINS